MSTHIQGFMLQAYLNRELDSATEAEFELELLSDPELADLAAADTALLLGLGAASPSAVALTTQSLSKPAMRTKAPWLRFAAAASVLMLLAAALGYTFNPKTHTWGGAQLAYIDKQRSVGNSIQIKLPRVGPLVLMIPVASATACLADISITQMTSGRGSEKQGRTITARAQPDNFGYAVVVLANDTLVPGSVAISVACQGTDVGQYDVQVLVAD